MPPNTIYVGRPTMWGNPFDLAVTYEEWLTLGARCWNELGVSSPRLAKILIGLPLIRGLNLACWCPLDKPCHADVLLELANK
jgi:hypothetical protein